MKTKSLSKKKIRETVESWLKAAEGRKAITVNHILFHAYQGEIDAYQNVLMLLD
jgi:hypothetical protein